MKSTDRGRCRIRGVLAGVLCGVVLVVAEVTASAGRPLSDYEFSLRFPAAISRFASYADVAGLGGAQAGSEWSSSNNPASAAWRHTGQKYTNSFSPQFSAIRFEESTDLYVISEAVVLDAGDWGVFLPAASQVWSNHAEDSAGIGFRLDADNYQLQWAKLITKDWAVGATFSVLVSDTRYDNAGVQVAESKGESYGFRIGLLHQLLKTLRVGLVVDYGFAPARTNSLSFDPATFTFGTVRSTDTTHQFLARVGVTWEYAPGCTLYVDYQGGAFWNDTGSLQVHRFPIGIEHAIIKDILFARVGALFDTRGDVSVTGGLGLSLGTRASLDLAYQYNMFPEIEPEFGRSQTFVVSVGVAF